MSTDGSNSRTSGDLQKDVLLLIRERPDGDPGLVQTILSETKDAASLFTALAQAREGVQSIDYFCKSSVLELYGRFLLMAPSHELLQIEATNSYREFCKFWLSDDEIVENELPTGPEGENTLGDGVDGQKEPEEGNKEVEQTDEKDDGEKETTLERPGSDKIPGKEKDESTDPQVEGTTMEGEEADPSNAETSDPTENPLVLSGPDALGEKEGEERGSIDGIETETKPSSRYTNLSLSDRVWIGVTLSGCFDTFESGNFFDITSSEQITFMFQALWKLIPTQEKDVELLQEEEPEQEWTKDAEVDDECEGDELDPENEKEKTKEEESEEEESEDQLREQLFTLVIKAMGVACNVITIAEPETLQEIEGIIAGLYVSSQKKLWPLVRKTLSTFLASNTNCISRFATVALLEERPVDFQSSPQITKEWGAIAHQSEIQEWQDSVRTEYFFAVTNLLTTHPKVFELDNAFPFPEIFILSLLRLSSPILEVRQSAIEICVALSGSNRDFDSFHLKTDYSGFFSGQCDPIWSPMKWSKSAAQQNFHLGPSIFLFIEAHASSFSQAQLLQLFPLLDPWFLYLADSSLSQSELPSLSPSSPALSSTPLPTTSPSLASSPVSLPPSSPSSPPSVSLPIPSPSIPSPSPSIHSSSAPSFSEPPPNLSPISHPRSPGHLVSSPGKPHSPCSPFPSSGSPSTESAASPQVISTRMSAKGTSSPPAQPSSPVTLPKSSLSSSNSFNSFSLGSNQNGTSSQIPPIFSLSQPLSLPNPATTYPSAQLSMSLALPISIFSQPTQTQPPVSATPSAGIPLAPNTSSGTQADSPALRYSLLCLFNLGIYFHTDPLVSTVLKSVWRSLIEHNPSAIIGASVLLFVDILSSGQPKNIHESFRWTLQCVLASHPLAQKVILSSILYISSFAFFATFYSNYPDPKQLAVPPKEPFMGVGSLGKGPSSFLFGSTDPSKEDENQSSIDDSSFSDFLSSPWVSMLPTHPQLPIPALATQMARKSCYPVVFHFLRALSSLLSAEELGEHLAYFLHICLAVFLPDKTYSSDCFLLLNDLIGVSRSRFPVFDEESDKKVQLFRENFLSETNQNQVWLDGGLRDEVSPYHPDFLKNLLATFSLLANRELKKEWAAVSFSFCLNLADIVIQRRSLLLFMGLNRSRSHSTLYSLIFLLCHTWYHGDEPDKQQRGLVEDVTKAIITTTHSPQSGSSSLSIVFAIAVSFLETSEEDLFKIGTSLLTKAFTPPIYLTQFKKLFLKMAHLWFGSGSQESSEGIHKPFSQWSKSSLAQLDRHLLGSLLRGLEMPSTRSDVFWILQFLVPLFSSHPSVTGPPSPLSPVMSSTMSAPSSPSSMVALSRASPLSVFSDDATTIYDDNSLSDDIPSVGSPSQAHPDITSEDVETPREGSDSPPIPKVLLLCLVYCVCEAAEDLASPAVDNALRVLNETNFPQLEPIRDLLNKHGLASKQGSSFDDTITPQKETIKKENETPTEGTVGSFIRIDFEKHLGFIEDVVEQTEVDPVALSDKKLVSCFLDEFFAIFNSHFSSTEITLVFHLLITFSFSAEGKRRTACATALAHCLRRFPYHLAPVEFDQIEQLVFQISQSQEDLLDLTHSLLLYAAERAPAECLENPNVFNLFGGLNVPPSHFLFKRAFFPAFSSDPKKKSLPRIVECLNSILLFCQELTGTGLSLKEMNEEYSQQKSEWQEKEDKINQILDEARNQRSSYSAGLHAKNSEAASAQEKAIQTDAALFESIISEITWDLGDELDTLKKKEKKKGEKKPAKTESNKEGKKKSKAKKG